MATDPLAMHTLLEQLDHDLEAGKSYPNEAAQDHFFQQLITDTQLQNQSKPGQGGLHTHKSLREMLRYTLRGNKKTQYGPGGSDKKESQDALNHFFTIGSDMLKETYLAKLEGLVQKKAGGISESTTAGVRRSKNMNPPAPASQSTQGNKADHDSTSRARESNTRAEHQVLLPDSPVEMRNFKPAPYQPGWQTINVPRRERSRSNSDNTGSNKRTKTTHQPSKVVVLSINKEAIPEPVQDHRLSATTFRSEHITDPLRFPYGLPTPSLSPRPIASRPITSNRPPLGSPSQAEVLADIQSITTAITSFLGTPQLYSPPSPNLATLLGNGTYTPSSPNSSCSPASHGSVWEWLIENIFSRALPSSSPHLGILGDPSVQRAVETTERDRILDADGIVRELALAQLRDPDFEIGHRSGPEGAWRKICQMAWRLKGKMSVSREEFVVVRDRENGCTGVAMKQELGHVREDAGLGRALSPWRPAL
ncbi:hypothetical protein AC579_10223 [Pseudocercospora musae]|uniref:Uncharacterized protein n=1 Tax=Pseudocercospora musae TaxID=113226 RepID=A0A139HEB7_9PEZI|nr:hypothetical protein AC579_10223 [Pseudocercospora musae]